ncbi:phospholipase [Actinoplanes sp. CA-252034]|uniref:phospholipase n=1 Tax=Actinoplanes sp. CA-252034 TaxID=3239906 RepID=UPI003D99D3A4
MSLGHGDHHHHHHTYAPSGQGTVMLNIGGTIGALIIHTPATLHGHEIEVSPVGDTGHRTHAAVRARYVRSGVTFCVVIDSLPEGRYVVWQDDDTPLTQVEVTGGAVAEVTWPANLIAGRAPVAV